jgi:hypothetical protein
MNSIGMNDFVPLFENIQRNEHMELACVCARSKTERDASNDLEFWAAF